LFHFNGNTSYLTTSTLNAKYIWAVLIKLQPQVTGKLYYIEIALVLLPINNSEATVDEK
jgi:hypothetical protein